MEQNTKIEPHFDDENTELTEPPQGNYIFHFNPKESLISFRFLVMSRETGKVVRAIEPILKALIEAQKQDKTFELNSFAKS